MKRTILIPSLLAITFFVACNDNRNSSQSTMGPMVKGNTYQEAFKIYNNPKSDKITISYRSLSSGKGIITVYYEDGRVHGQKQVVVNKGINTWEYTFPNKPGGIYVLQFTFNKIERVQRVFKAST